MDNKKNREEKFEKAVEDIKEVLEDDFEEAKDKTDEFKEKAEKVIEEVTDTIMDAVKDIPEDFKEKYLNVMAEMENFRKRAEKERMDLFKYRASSFIQEILPTLDMFEMAMSATNVSDEIKNWLIGFEMILKNFKSTLESEGVKEITTNVGDEFNSDYHHAIDEKESGEIAPGKILEIKSKGYLIHDRLLRPAAVIVAKKKETKGEENE